MARRIKYKLGDVFLVPLENDLYGVGRILRKDEATILVEMYRIKPIRDLSEYDYSEVTKEEPIMVNWMYDTAIKRGTWEIIDNQPVPEHIDMPYFWYRDWSDLKYYVEKGSEESYCTVGERVEISKKDIEDCKYCGSGIANELYNHNVYIKRLKKFGYIE